LASKAIEFGEKTQNKGYYAVGRYQSKARICEFLLVINNIWHPISYRFGVFAAYCSNFGHFAFWALFGRLRDNVRRSSWAHWSGQVPTTVKL